MGVAYGVDQEVHATAGQEAGATTRSNAESPDVNGYDFRADGGS